MLDDLRKEDKEQYEIDLKKLADSLNQPLTRRAAHAILSQKYLGMKRRKESLVSTEKKSQKKKIIKRNEPKVAKPKAKQPESKPKQKKEKKETKETKPKSNAGGFFLMNKYTKLFDEDCKDFLESKCENKYCKYIHNFSKLWKHQNNEEFARRYYSLHQDFQVLAPYESKLFGRASLDLLFICDCSGSMSTWIDKCRAEISNIIDMINQSNPYAEVSVGFVGYRDFYNKENRLLSHDFTDDIEKIKAFVKNVCTIANNDTPEDVAGGLNLGLKMNWKSDAKYAILISDAPCHGAKYHNTKVHDNYPNGCPEGLVIEDLITEYANRNITLSVISITNETEKMFEIISLTYLEAAKVPMTVHKLGKDTSDLGFVVATGASKTLSSFTIDHISIKEFLNQIQKGTMENSDLNPELKKFIDKFETLVASGSEENKAVDQISTEEDSSTFFEMKEDTLKLELEIKKANENKQIPWKKLSIYEFNSICHSFAIPKDRNAFIDWKAPFIKKSQIKCKVTLQDEPFAQGEMRYAFYMNDQSLDQKLVGKINKVIKKEENTLQHLSKDILSVIVCQKLAYDFNDRIINFLPDTKLLINFVHAYIYELVGYCDENIIKPQLPSHQRFLSVENFIEGSYDKYNNNSGWTNSQATQLSLVAQAFSHFTWQITRGYLMVVDLQGVGSVLTDPQIHCLNTSKFGKGNLGYIGIMKFFITHRCNAYCKSLNLVHPRQKIKIDENYDFFVDKFEPPAVDKKIYKICDVCLKGYQASTFELYDKKKKCWDSFCDSCEQKRKATFTEGKCTNCHWKFKSSAYIYKMRRQEFPKTCSKCSKLNSDKSREEFNELQLKDNDDDQLTNHHD